MAHDQLVRYTPDADEPMSTAIVTALSEAKSRDVTEDECVLYDSIDPEALDEMFRQESADDTIKVEFTTHDAIVVVWGNGEVRIEVKDMESDPSRG